MANEAIKPGMVVKLKSGGPAMTIARVGTYNIGEAAYCVWFAGTEMVEKQVNVEALIEVKS